MEQNITNRHTKAHVAHMTATHNQRHTKMHTLRVTKGGSDLLLSVVAFECVAYLWSIPKALYRQAMQ